MSEERQDRGRQGYVFLILAGMGLLIVATVLIILFLLQGETVSVDGESEVEATVSMVCTSDEALYPFFAEGEQSIKVNAVLEKDKISTIALTLKIHGGDDAKTIEQTTTRLNAAMNKAFGANGMTADALGATYSVLEDASQMRIYSEARNLNSASAQFFLLEELSGNYNRKKVEQAYNDRGLDCVVTE